MFRISNSRPSSETVLVVSQGYMKYLVYPPFFKEKERIKEENKYPVGACHWKEELELKYEKSGQMGAREEHEDQSEQDESEH